MVLKAPVPGIEHWRAASFAMPFRFAETTLVQIETDEGLVDWGEAHAPVALQVSKAVVDTLLAPAVLGADPRDFAALWDRMYALMRPRGHALGFTLEAVSGMDIALVDLAEQALGVPVYRLLGGASRDRVRAYASVLPWVVKGYRALRAKLDIAVAGGKCECTHQRFADLIARGAYDVLQPDACRAGSPPATASACSPTRTTSASRRT